MRDQPIEEKSTGSLPFDISHAFAGNTGIWVCTLLPLARILRRRMGLRPTGRHKILRSGGVKCIPRYRKTKWGRAYKTKKRGRFFPLYIREKGAAYSCIFLKPPARWAGYILRRVGAIRIHEVWGER